MREDFHSIRHPLAIDRGLGRIAEEDDYARHVDQLIRQVLLTSPGERINRPDFGCGLRRMVFAPSSDAAASLLRATILQSLTTWLGGLILVEDTRVTAIDERFEVEIRYLLRARQERRHLNVEVAL